MQMMKQDYQIRTQGFAKAVNKLLRGADVLLTVVKDGKYIHDMINMSDITIDKFVDVAICKQVARYLARCIKSMELKYNARVTLEIKE